MESSETEIETTEPSSSDNECTHKPHARDKASEKAEHEVKAQKQDTDAEASEEAATLPIPSAAANEADS